MSVAVKKCPQQVEGHWVYETALIVLARQLFGLSPLGPLFIRATGALRFVVLDAGRSIAHFFLTFSLAAARLALATAF